jgi:hypothetical protein
MLSGWENLDHHWYTHGLGASEMIARKGSLFRAQREHLTAAGKRLAILGRYFGQTGARVLRVCAPVTPRQSGES